MYWSANAQATERAIERASGGKIGRGEMMIARTKNQILCSLLNTKKTFSTMADARGRLGSLCTENDLFGVQNRIDIDIFYQRTRMLKLR